MNHYLPKAESEFVTANGGTEFLKGLVRKAMEPARLPVAEAELHHMPSPTPTGVCRKCGGRVAHGCCLYCGRPQS